MLFLKGLILGFSVAAPVGPIGLLCIQRTFSKGRAAGFLTGMGAATADALYSCVAAFGFSWVSQFLVSQQTWLRLIGGLFLVYLGVKTVWSSPSGKAAESKGNSLLAMYLSTLLLTITNPATILSFAAMFAGLGMGSGGTNTVSAAALLVLSVFAGSAVWWLMLSGGIGLFQRWLDANRIGWINRISGALIVGLGLFAVVSVLS